MSESIVNRKHWLQSLLGSHYKSCKYLVFEQVLSEWSFKVTNKYADFTFCPVDKAEFLRFGGKFKEIMPTAEERFDIGDVCYGAKIDGHYAHLKWIAFNRSFVWELDSVINLSSDSVYLYDGYTLPEYRGLGLTSITLDKTFQFLFEIGIKKAYSFILPYNFPILRSKAREKARNIGSISYVKIFKFRLLRFKGETKGYSQTLAKMFSSSKTIS
jgi:GNAT superfamily N-acetyltransferase